MSLALHVHPEVRDALSDGRAVVALESTVITHGLPHPLNLETGLALEATVREAGATPATIALLEGRVRVGLNPEELERLAAGGTEKVSLWNLPALVARGRSGGTTVAATAHLAWQAGVEVFATGGIGGVHPDPYDESADLPALARTPIVVVSAGPKSILNIQATLERLETLGVPVIAYGTDRLPAFHSPESPFVASARLDTPLEVARAHRAARALGLAQALLVTRPIENGIPFATVQAWVEVASREARQKGVHGKALTPFLLRRLSDLSGGETDRINGRLLGANARLSAEIALALATEAS